MKKRKQKIQEFIAEPIIERSFDFYQDLPKEIVQWAREKIDEIVEKEGLEYDDNYRVAKVGEVEQEETYFRIQQNGCCGFCDVQLKGPDGEIYLIGFNYGH